MYHDPTIVQAAVEAQLRAALARDGRIMRERAAGQDALEELGAHVTHVSFTCDPNARRDDTFAEPYNVCIVRR